MGTLLDSSVLIRIERAAFQAGSAGDPADGWEEIIAALPEDEEIGLATITVSELLHGVHRASPDIRPRREAFVESVLADLPVLPFDLRTARVHAFLWAELRRRGDVIGPHDLIIAATALSIGWAVATFNETEFRRVPGLHVVIPNLDPRTRS